MLKNETIAIATATALAVVGLVGGGGLATPPAVDTYADQQPDDSFYGLEKLGESMKGAFKDDVDWNSALAEERMNEYKNMVQENKVAKYQNVLQNARNRLNKAMKNARSKKDMKTVRQVTRKHLQVLRRVENEVPEQARQGIQTAIRNSQRVQETVMEIGENMEESGRNIVTENELSDIRETCENISKEKITIPKRMRD